LVDFDFGISAENAESYPAPGEILLEDAAADRLVLLGGHQVLPRTVATLRSRRLGPSYPWRSHGATIAYHAGRGGDAHRAQAGLVVGGRRLASTGFMMKVYRTSTAGSGTSVTAAKMGLLATNHFRTVIEFAQARDDWTIIIAI
jgi:hypothetical protein